MSSSNTSPIDLQALCEVAISAAKAAGKIIRARMHEDISVEQKSGGSSYASQVVTEVDKACEAVILSHLKPTCQEYDLALLSEEDEDDGSRHVKDYFWCIDPLDGTLAFIEKRPDFAVSIGLVSRAGKPIIGVVYDPSRDTLYHAISGQGAFKNGAPWRVDVANPYLSYVTDHPLEKAVGRDQIEAIIQQTRQELGLSETKVISGGGLVINAMRTAENRPALMLKIPKASAGGGSLWDYAASACICTELGMEVRAFTGGALDLNRQEGTFMNEGGMFYGNGVKKSN